MKNVMPGASCINSTAQLSAYRRSLIELLGAAKVITLAEYEVAAHNIITCQALATLQKWYRNCIREIARREEAAPVPALVVYATVDQTQEIQRLLNHVSISRREKTQVLHTLPQLEHTQAVATIGSLWAKIIGRAGETPPADGWSRRGSEPQVSYSTAA